MQYDAVCRARGLARFWQHLKWKMAGYDWFHPFILPEVMPDLSHLPDHLRQDIGAPEPIRFMDWKMIQDKGPL